MVLYSKFAYGSQFSEEKNDLKIRYLVAEILSKQTCSFLLIHPVWIDFLLPLLQEQQKEQPPPKCNRMKCTKGSQFGQLYVQNSIAVYIKCLKEAEN